MAMAIRIGYLLALVIFHVEAIGQGTLYFMTRSETDPGNGPWVYDVDGTTKLGSNFKGQIYAGPTAGQLTPAGGKVAGQDVIFRFGQLAGQGNSSWLGQIASYAVLVGPNVPANVQGFYQLRAWEGGFASFEAAFEGGGKWGVSEIVSGRFGTGVAADHLRTDGFSSFSLVSPIQYITFDALPEKVSTDPPFAISAAASSGLAVTFTSSDTNVATVSGNTVTIVGSGSTTITASQAGGNGFAPAQEVIQALVVTVSQNEPTIAMGRAIYLSSSNLIAGTAYQIQVSTNLTNWVDQWEPFVASNEAWESVKYWKTDKTNYLYFRLIRP